MSMAEALKTATALPVKSLRLSKKNVAMTSQYPLDTQSNQRPRALEKVRCQVRNMLKPAEIWLNLLKL